MVNRSFHSLLSSSQSGTNSNSAVSAVHSPDCKWLSSQSHIENFIGPSRGRTSKHLSVILYSGINVCIQLTCTAANKWERYTATTCLCFLSQSCKKASENLAVVCVILQIIVIYRWQKRKMSFFPSVSSLPTWSCWVSIEILFCSAICCPGLPWWADEEDEDVMPRGGDRAPRASFSRNTSLDSSVICTKTDTSVCPPHRCFNSSSDWTCDLSPCGPSPWPGPGSSGFPCGAPGCDWTGPVIRLAAAALWPAGTLQPASHSC